MVTVAIVLAAGVVIITVSLPASPSPQATLLIELAKLFATAVLVGIFGVWAKQVLEHIELYKHELAARAAARKGLVESIQLCCRGALSCVADLKLTDVSAFSALFVYGDEKADFGEMLVRLKEFEPDVANSIQYSFDELEKDFNEQRLSPGFRKKADSVVATWSRKLGACVIGGVSR
jgi:hypothetical protein